MVVYFTDTHGVLDGSVTVGTPFSATITYDTTLPDGSPADPSTGDYLQSIPPGVYSMSVGSYVIDAIDDRIIVSNDVAEPPVDLIDFNVSQRFAFPGVSGASIYQLDLGLQAVDASVLSSDALPSTPLTVADVIPSSRYLTLLGCTDADLLGGTCTTASIEIDGHVTSMPEPGPGTGDVAAGLALAAGGTRSRWRRRGLE
jgi:hypothetical protein